MLNNPLSKKTVFELEQFCLNKPSKKYMYPCQTILKSTTVPISNSEVKENICNFILYHVSTFRII